jgi:hypothetical protein
MRRSDTFSSSPPPPPLPPYSLPPSPSGALPDTPVPYLTLTLLLILVFNVSCIYCTSCIILHYLSLSALPLLSLPITTDTLASFKYLLSSFLSPLPHTFNKISHTTHHTLHTIIITIHSTLSELSVSTVYTTLYLYVLLPGWVYVQAQGRILGRSGVVGGGGKGE